MDSVITTQRLILPRDANHHGTLYAGTLLTVALEAAYACAYRAVGASANLVLRRVLDLRCYRPVPIGAVAEISGVELTRMRAALVVGLIGTPLHGSNGHWMDGIMQFVQVDESGRPDVLEAGVGDSVELSAEWLGLRERASKLLTVRGSGRARASTDPESLSTE